MQARSCLSRASSAGHSERSLVISVLSFGHYLPAPPLALSAVPGTHLPWAPCLGPSSPGTTVWLQVLAMCHLLKEATLSHAAASPSTLRQMGDTCGHGGLSLPPVPTPFIQSPLSSPSSNRQPMGCSREVRRPPSRGHVRICSPKHCSHQERKPGPASWRRRDHGEGDRAVLTEALLNQLATTRWQGKTAKTRRASAEPKLHRVIQLWAP